MINTITKKPYFSSGGEIGYYVGSFGLSRFTADINAPVSQKEKVAIRVNAAYHTEGSFQDAGFKKSLFITKQLEPYTLLFKQFAHLFVISPNDNACF